MPTIGTPNIKKKNSISPTVKLILLVAVILGLIIWNCSQDREKSNILFEEITHENSTHLSVEVMFYINNKTLQSGRKPVLIQVFTSSGDMIASRITSIDLEPRSRRRIIRIIDNFERPLRADETISHVNVELFQRSFLGRR